jgi:hypothetical protein
METGSLVSPIVSANCWDEDVDELWVVSNDQVKLNILGLVLSQKKIFSQNHESIVVLLILTSDHRLLWVRKSYLQSILK